MDICPTFSEQTGPFLNVKKPLTTLNPVFVLKRGLMPKAMTFNKHCV
jgi:hypothetical protein